MAVKLEWFQAIRKVLWDFLYNYDMCKDDGNSSIREQFFMLERQINSTLDIFLRHFFMSFSEYKDELIRKHREMIDDLAVPIIPLSSTVAILPLNGMIDAYRTNIIQEKALTQISSLKVRKLVMDLSGVARIDSEVVSNLFKIINGIGYMGCQSVITGIRPEVAAMMVDLGIELGDKVQTAGTLQQALELLGLTIEA